MRSPDTLQRFLFESNAIRGELVHLDSAFSAIRGQHAYPLPVSRLLGHALAASALLSATIKYHDSLILQARGSGAVQMLVAQCSANRSLRGLARWTDPVPDAGPGELCGTGDLVITIDPGSGGERYQGLVDLGGRTLAESLERYFAQSEQLATRLWLACDGEVAAGMLLQRLPGEALDPDAWNRVTRLGATLSDAELLGLSVEEVRHRLFHEEDIRLFEPERTTFRCGCSRETIEAVLRSLGRAELEDILQQEGEIGVSCEFCNRHYRFDAVDAEHLLREQGPPLVPATRH